MHLVKTFDIRHHVRMARVALLVLAAVLPLSAQVEVELIIDASGSMYNTFGDGEYRIVAAKHVLTEFVNNLPADKDLHVGFRAIGAEKTAQEPGACRDTRLHAAVKGVDRGRLLAAVKAIRARGATPLALSLRQAAGDFRLQGKKVVVLVTDGEESCGGDVRATIAELEAMGIHVVLRVVGIDLDDDVAERYKVLGTFENARNQRQLASALWNAFQPDLQTYTVRITITREYDRLPERLSARMVNVMNGESYDLHGSAADGVFGGQMPGGPYRAEITVPGRDTTVVFGGLTVAPDSANAFALKLRLPPPMDLAIAPSNPFAGQDLTVTFGRAPAGGRRFVVMSRADAPTDECLGGVEVRGDSGTVSLQLPFGFDTMQIRFCQVMSDGTARVVARTAAFAPRGATVVIRGPATRAPLEPFEVEWDGPNAEGDWIAVVRPGEKAENYQAFGYTAKGNPVPLASPLDTGVYEVRYVTAAGNRTLGSTGLRVAMPHLVLAALDTVRAETEVEISWAGYDSRDAIVEIVSADPRIDTEFDFARTLKGSPVTLVAPVDPGAYRIRFTVAAGRRVLAARSLVVVGETATLRAPPRVVAGAEFQVYWSGPDRVGDYLSVESPGPVPGQYPTFAYTDAGSPATIVAPAIPGVYELRYVTHRKSRVLARVPLSVVAR